MRFQSSTRFRCIFRAEYWFTAAPSLVSACDITSTYPKANVPNLGSNGKMLETARRQHANRCTVCACLQCLPLGIGGRKAPSMNELTA